MSKYRDSKTGKFVSKSTWTRSRAQGGNRYKRVSGAPVSRRSAPAITNQKSGKFKSTGALKARTSKPPKTMIRVTVGFKYVHKNESGKKVSGTSKATTWVKTEKQAERAIARLERLAEDATNEVISRGGEYDYSKADWWFPKTPSRSKQRVPYDDDLLDTFDVIDEEDNYFEK